MWCRKQKAELIFSAGNSFKEGEGAISYVTRRLKFVRSCHTFQKRVWFHYFVKIWGPTGELFDPEGEDQGQVECTDYYLCTE